MTYALTLLAKLNTCGYRSLKIASTINGMMGEFVDTDDGQVYRVEVTPIDMTLSPEAIKETING